MVQDQSRRETSMYYRRIEDKLGVCGVGPYHDLARLAEEGLPVSAMEALSSHGMTEEEIYKFIVPCKILTQHRSVGEPLTHEESTVALRMTCIIALAEEIFGDDAKAGRWLRKPKTRFEGLSPMELLQTEAGTYMVEEMLLQLDYGFAA